MSNVSTRTNRQIRLAARPFGMPKPSDWSHVTESVGSPDDGGILVKTHLLSLDPAMRGWMNEGKSYIAPVGINEVMRAGGVGEVVESKNPAFPIGTMVNAGLGVQEYCLILAADIKRAGVFAIDTKAAPAQKWLNALGMQG